MGFFVVVLLGVLPSSAISDDVGLTRARLIELEGAVYLIEADVSSHKVASLGRPVFPERFAAGEHPDILPRGAYLTRRYTFQGGEGVLPLNAEDTLLLPWDRAGVILDVFWLGQEPRRAVLAASGPEGIRVPVAALKESKVSGGERWRRGFADGLRHLVVLERGGLVHALLVAAILLIAPSRRWFSWVMAFAFGQALVMPWHDLGGSGFPPLLAEALVGIGVVLLARAYRPRVEQSKVTSRGYLRLVGLLGFVHGLGLLGEVDASVGGENRGSASLWVLFGMANATDLMQLCVVGVAWLSAAMILVLRRGSEKDGSAVPGPVSTRLWSCGRLIVGGLAVALTLLSVRAAVEGPQGPQRSDDGGAARLVARFESSLSVGGTTAGSGQVSRGMTQPVLAFLTIEAREVRLEVLVQVATGGAALVPETVRTIGMIPLEQQQALKNDLVAHWEDALMVEMDGEALAPDLRRADFVEVSQSGVTIRDQPQPERLESAVIGLSYAWERDVPPTTASVRWMGAPATGFTVIPVTLAGPMGTEVIHVTAETPDATWRDDGSGLAFRSEEIRAVPVSQTRFPFLSLGLLVAASVFAMVTSPRLRGRMGIRLHGFGSPLLRRALLISLLVVAILAYPSARVSTGVPRLGSGLLKGQEVSRVLGGLLTNLYRAFEYRSESVIYDQLATSVTGEQLEETYLELRRAFELENRGGARARVDQLEILQVSEVEVIEEGGFRARAKWRAGGSVSHFGHIHDRQNAYDAVFEIVPVEGNWKMREVELLEERREP